MVTGELKTRIDSVWDLFWANGLTNPLSVIEQITDLLFLRILDTPGRTRTDGTPLFDEAHACCRWSVFSALPPEEMLAVMRDVVYPFLRTAVTKEPLYAECLRDAALRISSPRLLARAVEVLGALDLHDRDIMGDVYEYLLSRLAVSGTNGQFRTPRHIIRMMCTLAAPVPGDIVCDPAMGSAGFLCGAVQAMAGNAVPALRGFDTDATMLRIGAMNLLLHGIPDPQVRRLDALSAENTASACCTLIMANPPFTGSLDPETLAPDLAELSTKKTELLFLALFLRMLAPGGRCVCIVPDGVLFGSTKAHRILRRRLLDENTLHAVIAMPSGVFRPYAGVSSAVLVFKKGGHTGRVWFYGMEADGFSLDDKRIPTAENDIPDLLARYAHPEREAGRSRTERSFFVTREEIAAQNDRLDLKCYRMQPEAEMPLPPAPELLDEIEAMQQEIAGGIRSLRELLS
ncbi:MAG: N-6 DNA methylase [Oscillospiraceae bacterium]|nr:N-6 DNA methylase [Oscillospiraceae bacterium]